MENIIKNENEEDKKILMKGKDIVQTNYCLKPVENKIFQLVLYNNQKQKHNGICECEIPILDFANIIGNKNERTLKDIELKLKTIMKKSLTFYNSKIKGEYQLISGYEVISERNSINVIMLERVVEIMQQYQANKAKLSPYAPINLSLFFELRSFYAQKLYDELRLWSRYNQEIVHAFSLEELRFITGVEDKYPKWCNFSQKVLDVAVREINEKAKMIVSYIPLKVNRVVQKIEFTIFDNEPHIYFNNRGFVQQLNDIKNKNISQLEESFRIYIDNEIREIESLLFNNSNNEDRINLEKKIQNLKKEIQDEINKFNFSSNIVVEECIDISKGALKLFKNDFNDIDFNDNDYYMLLLDSFSKTIDKTENREITADKNYKYFKTVLKGAIESFEAQRNLESICEEEEDVVENKYDNIEEVEHITELYGTSEQDFIDQEILRFEDVKEVLKNIESIIGEIAYKCWIEAGILDIAIEGSTIKFICSNTFTKNMIKRKYSEYINEIIINFYNQITTIEYVDDTHINIED